MGSFKHPRVFDPLDLEIIDRVYEAAWARVEANEPDRDRSREDARKEALRQWVFALVDHPVEFDALYERLEKVPTSWLLTVAGRSQGHATRPAPRQRTGRKIRAVRPRMRSQWLGNSIADRGISARSITPCCHGLGTDLI